MQKFLVLYMAPIASLEAWMKTDEETRKKEMAEMEAQWGSWMTEHAALFSGPTFGAGATKRVTAAGVVDTKNDVMMYSIVEAASHQEAAEAFTSNPHVGIPGSWIDVMPMNPIPNTGN